MNQVLNGNSEADEFSSTAERCEVSLPCQEGNLFRLSLPESMSCPFTLMAAVGDQCSSSLPENQGYMLRNKLSGTIGSLRLYVGKRPYVITDDVRAFGNISKPQDVRSHVLLEPLPRLAPWPKRLNSPQPMVPIGRSSMRPANAHGTVARGHEYNALDAISEDAWKNAGSPVSADGEALPAMPSHPIVMVIEPPTDFGSAPPEGDYDVETMPDELVDYFVASIHATTSELPGDITRAGVDAVLQVRDKLSSPENRRFLREMAGTKLSIIRANGRRVLAYNSGPWKAGQLWHRRHMVYGARGFGRINVSAMNIAVQGMGANIAEGLRGMSGRAGIIGMVFAVGFDVAEYLTNDGEKFLSDLLISVGFTAANAVLSIIVGTAIASAAMALAAAAGIALAPAVIVGVGIAAVVGVGFAINRIVAATGLKTAVQEFVRGLDWYEDAWKSGMTDDEIYQGMMTAP